jgi:excisionase family DNA binding protein
MGKAQYYTPAEAGEVLRLRPSTVRFLCDTRRLRAIRTASGRRLIPAGDLERLRRDRESKRTAPLKREDGA